MVNLYVAEDETQKPLYRGVEFLAKLLWKQSDGLGHFGIAYQTGIYECPQFKK